MEYFDRAVDYLDKAKRAMTKTETEAKMSEALSRQNWGPSSTQMRHIANLSFDYHEYGIVMGEIWLKMDYPKQKWRQIFKALVLLEYLIKHGAERVIEEAQNYTYKIKSLQNFSYKSEDGREKGQGIREYSKKLCELLEDTKAIRESRKQAKKLKNKYTGLGNNGIAPRSSYEQYDSYDFDSTSQGRYKDNEERNTYNSSTSNWNSNFKADEAPAQIGLKETTNTFGIKLKRTKSDKEALIFEDAEPSANNLKPELETDLLGDFGEAFAETEENITEKPIQNELDLDPFATLASDVQKNLAINETVTPSATKTREKEKDIFDFF